MTGLVVPPALVEKARLGPPWDDWLDRLPRLHADVVEEWSLTVDGGPTHGHCSVVTHVRTTAGRPAVLKIGLPDDEGEHEHLALQHWQGNGAVLLLRADPHRRAMLLERLHADDLSDLWDVAACETVASLYSRLHLPAVPQLRRLTTYVDRWTTALTELPRDAPVPRRLVEQAVSLGRSFLTDDASTGRIIHTDLHYGNVLAGDREPWLVIDPKPVSGDPHYEVAPLLWNRWDDVVGSGRVRDTVRARFHAVVDTAGLDEDRARDWVVVRALHDALWTLQEAQVARRSVSSDERDRVTTMVTVAKAVQA